CGHAAEAVAQLRREGLHHGVLPLLDAAMGRAVGERFVQAALRRTDERIREGKPVSPGFLFAALLWPEVHAEWKNNEARGEPTHPALLRAMDHVVKAQSGTLPTPHRFAADMREIWAMQPRFLQRSGRRPYRLLEQPRFRAAYDFLLLRCESGEADASLGEGWERVQRAGEAERAQTLTGEGEQRKRRRRRRRRPARAPASAPREGGESPAG